MQEGTSGPRFPKHFDGKRFHNPDAAQAPGLLEALRWKLTSRPEPSPRFIPDVEQSTPPRRVEGSGLRTTLPSIAFRQNITIQFCSNLLPVEREEADTPHPCVSVSIRGQIACFLWRPVSFRSLFFGPRMDTDTHG